MGLLGWLSGQRDESYDNGSEWAETAYDVVEYVTPDQVDRMARDLRSASPDDFYEGFADTWNELVDSEESKPWWKVW